MKIPTMDPKLLVITRALHYSELRLEGWSHEGEERPRRIYLKSREDWTKVYLKLIHWEISDAARAILNHLDSGR